MNTPSSYLILGGTGGIGHAFTDQLLADGKAATLLVRNPQEAAKAYPADARITFVQGDVQDAALLKRLGAQAEVIFFGINYPYHQWQGTMQPALANTIAAAAGNHATIVFPGNVYNYGLVNQPITEKSPFAPNSSKGRIRVELENMLMAATNQGLCRVLNVRMPDFWGPHVINAGMAPIFENALAHKAMPALLTADVPHQVVYIRNGGRVMYALLGVEGLPDYALVNYGGTVLPSARAWFTQIAGLAGWRTPKVVVYPRIAISLLALFNPIVKAAKEMLYLQDHTVVLDDSYLHTLLPDLKETPMAEAITETLDWFRARQAKS